MVDRENYEKQQEAFSNRTRNLGSSLNWSMKVLLQAPITRHQSNGKSLAADVHAKENASLAHIIVAQRVRVGFLSPTPIPEDFLLLSVCAVVPISMLQKECTQTGNLCEQTPAKEVCGCGLQPWVEQYHHIGIDNMNLKLPGSVHCVWVCCVRSRFKSSCLMQPVSKRVLCVCSWYLRVCMRALFFVLLFLLFHGLLIRYSLFLIILFASSFLSCTIFSKRG